MYVCNAIAQFQNPTATTPTTYEPLCTRHESVCVDFSKIADVAHPCSEQAMPTLVCFSRINLIEMIQLNETLHTRWTSVSAIDEGSERDVTHMRSEMRRLMNRAPTAATKQGQLPRWPCVNTDRRGH